MNKLRLDSLFACFLSEKIQQCVLHYIICISPLYEINLYLVKQRNTDYIFFLPCYQLIMEQHQYHVMSFLGSNNCVTNAGWFQGRRLDGVDGSSGSRELGFFSFTTSSSAGAAPFCLQGVRQNAKIESKVPIKCLPQVLTPHHAPVE